MAITFTWSVKDMHKVTETGGVYRVDWSCSGVDADTEVSHRRSGQYMHTAAVEQTVSMTIKQETVTTTETVVKRAMPDPTAVGFVAYDSLNEATVLGWIKANGEGAKVEALITKSINSKIANNANSKGMPWAAE
tara:strand:+ start:1030 stop:1431 length:402 start_codon:yes stop_codon:yes gene_type:complete